MKRFLSAVLILLFFVPGSLKAFIPSDKPFFDDNKRYLAIMLLNLDEDGNYVPDIEAAHDNGFNAVYLTIRWDEVKCHNNGCRIGLLPRPTSVNPNWDPSTRYWAQVDQEVAAAKRLGMKLAFRIHLGSSDFGTGRSESLWGKNSYMERPEDSWGQQGPEDLGGVDLRQFSLSRPSAIDSAKLFIAEVLNRYGYLERENNLLFLSVTLTGTQEIQYSSEFLLDYSEASKREYQQWYRTRYGMSCPGVPKDFTSAEGERWYLFRHKKLKEFVDNFSAQIKSYNPAIRVVNDYGSVFDNMTSKRATFGFKSLGEHTDGIKVNDDYFYDHRFSMDIIRTNFPGRWIMNETLIPENGTPDQHNYYDFIDQSFAHGAKLFSVVASARGIKMLSPLFQKMRKKWLLSDMTPVKTHGSIRYSFSEILSAHFDGNKFSTSTRNIYQEWLDIYNNNPPGAKAVNVYFDDDELN